MMSALLSSTKPLEAAARPVNAFRNEITTGMSAPPIGQHEQDAEEEREHEQQHHPDAGLGRAGEDREDERGGEQHAAFTTCWPGNVIGRAGHELLELRERDHAAREADRADERGEHDRGDRVAGDVLGRRRQPVELRGRDQGRRARRRRR